MKRLRSRRPEARRGVSRLHLMRPPARAVRCCEVGPYGPRRPSAGSLSNDAPKSPAHTAPPVATTDPPSLRLPDTGRPPAANACSFAASKTAMRPAPGPRGRSSCPTPSSAPALSALTSEPFARVSPFGPRLPSTPGTGPRTLPRENKMGLSHSLQEAQSGGQTLQPLSGRGKRALSPIWLPERKPLGTCPLSVASEGIGSCFPVVVLKGTGEPANSPLLGTEIIEGSPGRSGRLPNERIRVPAGNSSGPPHIGQGDPDSSTRRRLARAATQTSAPTNCAA